MFTFEGHPDIDMLTIGGHSHVDLCTIGGHSDVDLCTITSICTISTILLIYLLLKPIHVTLSTNTNSQKYSGYNLYAKLNWGWAFEKLVAHLRIYTYIYLYIYYHVCIYRLSIRC